MQQQQVNGIPIVDGDGPVDSQQQQQQQQGYPPPPQYSQAPQQFVQQQPPPLYSQAAQQYIQQAPQYSQAAQPYSPAQQQQLYSGGGQQSFLAQQGIDGMQQSVQMHMVQYSLPPQPQAGQMGGAGYVGYAVPMGYPGAGLHESGSASSLQSRGVQQGATLGAPMYGDPQQGLQTIPQPDSYPTQKASQSIWQLLFFVAGWVTFGAGWFVGMFAPFCTQQPLPPFEFTFFIINSVFGMVFSLGILAVPWLILYCMQTQQGRVWTT